MCVFVGVFFLSLDSLKNIRRGPVLCGSRGNAGLVLPLIQEIDCLATDYSSLQHLSN